MSNTNQDSEAIKEVDGSPTADEAELCEFCDSPAIHALCHSIVKIYPYDGGGIDWDEGETVTNDDPPVYLCGDCWANEDLGDILSRSVDDPW